MIGLNIKYIGLTVDIIIFMSLLKWKEIIYNIRLLISQMSRNAVGMR